MFWRFGGYNNVSSLDTILEKPDVTLEDVLDDQDLLQEIKANNSKLIEFLRDESRLRRLLEYVVAPKPAEVTEEEEATHAKNVSRGFFAKSKGRSKSRDVSELEEQERKRLKYAYTACEVLSSEVWSIYEALFENQDLLRVFWEYIKSDSPLDSLQAGYFTKVNDALLEKKANVMVTFVKSLDDVVPNFMRHVDCPMMMDLLLKLISLEKEPACQGIVDWLQSQELIPILLSYINADHPTSTQTSAGDFLKAIITISANATGQDQSVIGPNELTRELVSEKRITALVKEMLKGGNPLTVGVGIIIEVIRKNNSDYDSETQVGPEPKSSDPIYLGTLLRIFSEHIKDFMELILSPKHTIMTEKGSTLVERKNISVAWGGKIEPLGFDRFKTCELMAELLHCSNMGLLNEKGSDAAVKFRDVERQRLKAEGKLVNAQQQLTADEYGTSVDSSGFHHAEAFSPLSGSPDHVKRLEVQNSIEEDEFEKVALSEAVLESGDESEKRDNKDQTSSLPQDELLELLNDHNLKAQSRSEHEDTTRAVVGDEIHQSRFESKIPDVTGQTEDAIELEGNPVDASEDKPAPLFANRTSNVNPSEPGNEAVTSDSSTLGNEDGSQSVLLNEQSQQEMPVIEKEDDGSPLVGDLLKTMFVEHHVVPTILDFFFRFPWNNFLHNVVYDVVQQVFNGSMERGFNRYLAIDLFEVAQITNRIVEGQQRNNKSQEENKMRLGYMGHLTLIAEEVIKFNERQPAELLSQSVMDKLSHPDFVYYIQHTLPETRDRDNAILGGIRPDGSGGPRQAVLNAVNVAQGSFGNTGSSALANAGLTGTGGGGGGATGLDSMDLASAGAAGYGIGGTPSQLLSGFGSSDEEDEELEEGEVGVNATQRPSHQLEDEDQVFDGDAPSTHIDLASTPAPLAIPPSRARGRLAARLAEKQRLAESMSSSSVTGPADANTPVSNTPNATAATPPTKKDSHLSRRFGQLLSTNSNPSSEDEEESAGVPKKPRAAGNSMFQGLGDDDTSGSEIEDDVDVDMGMHEDDLHTHLTTRNSNFMQDRNRDVDEDEDIDPPWRGVRRQTTREAVKRRPLEIDDDSDDNDDRDNEDEDSDSHHNEEDTDADADARLQAEQDEEDAAANAKPLARTASGFLRTHQVALSERESAISAAIAEERAGAAKRWEQDKLLRQWGLPSSGNAGNALGSAKVSESAKRENETDGNDNDNDSDDDDDEDEDEEDRPVELGTKYLSRRSAQDLVKLGKEKERERQQQRDKERERRSSADLGASTGGGSAGGGSGSGASSINSASSG